MQQAWKSLPGCVRMPAQASTALVAALARISTGLAPITISASAAASAQPKRKEPRMQAS